MAAGKRQNLFDDDESTVTSAPPRPAPRPAGTGESSFNLPRVGTAPGVRVSTPPVTTARPTARPGSRFSSAFDDGERTHADQVLGRQRAAAAPETTRTTRSQLNRALQRIDGKKASPSVEISASDLKPLAAEVTSRAGDRQQDLTRVVLDQFAPETNLRYADGERGHVFVYDFTQAMGCAIPRWNGHGVELTMPQVCAWFRSLASEAGWLRVGSARAAELLKQGLPVVALPKTAGASLLAVARPDGTDPEGFPFLASACSRRRGTRLTAREAFGVRHADFYFHP